jgi:hypothetical protein
MVYVLNTFQMDSYNGKYSIKKMLNQESTNNGSRTENYMFRLYIQMESESNYIKLAMTKFNNTQVFLNLLPI